MVKNIYKTVILLFVFVGALFFFGQHMETDFQDNSKEVSMAKEKFPYVQLQTQGFKINTLYGYSAPMEPEIIRESITPLAEDKKLTVLLGKAISSLTKMEYRIVDKETGEVYDTGSISAIDEGQEKVEIAFSYNFKTSTEYILDLMGTSDEGREIHYYTRIKYYINDSKLAQKLAFAQKFHKTTFVKTKAQELERYLEPDGTNRNSSLAKVDITSSSDLITWGGMSPKIISDEWITIKEFNMETACVQYNYFIQAETASGQEIYHVKEFYRVRHASGQDFLLNFERTMEAQFDEKLASTKTSQLKLGITEEHKSRMLTNKEEDVLYFVRGGVLYRYDMENNEIMKVYQVFSEKAPYLYRAYNEQDIRLLKVDEDGSLYFCVYGYFPRGEYEGDVAVVLYEYTADGRLQEMVFMPSSTTYQQLKEDFEEYGYVSPRDIYYFTVANTVYAYNMAGRRLEKLVENVKANSFMIMEGVNSYVWSSSLSNGYGSNITIYNLETDERQMIFQPDKDTYIRLLGVIEDNVIYGYAKKKDVGRNKDGTKVVPCYELHIADTKGNVKKSFDRSGQYIQSIQANGNVINIKMCKKSGSTYVDTTEDSILCPTEVTTSKFSYSYRVTTKSLTEWYIQFPSGFELSEVPKEVQGPQKVLTSERYVRLEQPGIAKYYVYAVGKITASYENARQAIKDADDQMGVVVSSNHQVVWERSGSYLQNNIGGLEIKRSDDSISNLAACAYMLLKRNHIQPNVKTLMKKDTVYSMLAGYLSRPVNLKGCNLEQVLYFVSGNKPVIAMTSDNTAVVIGGYTTTQLSLYDPESGAVKTVSRSEYEKIFENAGNSFVSYMEE